MIGEGLSRTDGPLKVTGRALYSAERREMGEPLHGFILGAAIGQGRVASIDTSRAEAMAGVRLVWTHRNAPPQAAIIPKSDILDVQPQLTTDRIAHYGAPVAFVVADTFEQARAAAAAIDVRYDAAPGAFVLDEASAAPEWHDESRVGDLDAAMASSDATVDAVYATPYHFSQPMELHACIADWRNGHLTLHIASQMVAQLADAVADTILIGRDCVTVDSRFVGGGFGAKIALHAEAILSALATRQLNRPVQLVLTRRQGFTVVGHRPASISRVRLAASRDGRLTGIGHDANIQVSPEGNWKEGVATVARALYAAPHRLTRTRHSTLDTGVCEPVRGPGEVPGLMVFESAMDELAEKLGIDPVELRIRNDTAIDPEKNRPLSGRRLVECLREGAARFGWEQRPTTPASRRDGRWLIGYGVGSSIRGHYQTTAEARVRLEPDGQVIVQTDMTDIGTGTYTIAAQVAAAALGVPVGQVRVELARSTLPRGNGAGGSWGSGNTSVSIDRACQGLKEKIGQVAGIGYNDLFAEVRRHFPAGLEAVGTTLGMDDEPSYENFSIFTYGATFTEVGVDVMTGETRIRRMLGVFSAGRILNAKTARSQLIGGMIWGISAALHEAAHVDPRNGAWVNGDFAEYLVPTHADVPQIEAIALDDFDGAANHLGAKGIGELGSGGTAGSVANAVYNATGVRVRDFPITISKLLPGLPKI